MASSEYLGIQLLVQAGSFSGNPYPALQFLSHCLTTPQQAIPSTLSYLWVASQQSEGSHEWLGSLRDARDMMRKTKLLQSQQQPSGDSEERRQSAENIDIDGLPPREELYAAWLKKQEYERLVAEMQAVPPPNPVLLLHSSCLFFALKDLTQSLAELSRQLDAQVQYFQSQNKQIEEERNNREEQYKQRESEESKRLKVENGQLTAQSTHLASFLEEMIRQNLRKTDSEEEKRRDMIHSQEHEIREALRLVHRNFMEEKQRLFKIQVRQGVVNHWHKQIAMENEELYAELWNEKRRLALEQVEATRAALESKIQREEANEAARMAREAEFRAREKERKESFLQMRAKDREDFRKATNRTKEQAIEFKNRLTLWTGWLVESETGVPKVATI